ncbi:MAG: MFS transporter [Deltaproteobacteria bacterium]|nr:MFS transporter [Deltaproteobacteria bacterium]
MPKAEDRPFYKWVIVAVFFVVSTIMYGTQTSFGVFLKSISGEFGLARGATSAIFSVQNVFGAALSFGGGWSVDKYGPRLTVFFIGLSTGLSLLLTSQTNALWQLFITYSLLFGVIGSTYTTIMSTISRWFGKNRGLALGIAGLGIGLGPMIIAPFSTYLIGSFDWRMAYIILGAIAWVFILPLSQLLRRSPTDIKARVRIVESGSDEKDMQPPENDGGPVSELTLRGAIRTRSFWFFSISWLLTSFCFMMVMIHVVPHATDIGIPPMQAATILSVIGGCVIAGRLIIGKVSDNIGRKVTTAACALCTALAMIWLNWAQDLTMLYIFAAVFGLFHGGFDTIIAALIGDTFGVRNIGMIMGSLQVTFGLGMVVGSALAGVLFDINQSYFVAFLIGAAAMFIVSLLISLTRREIG